MKRWNIRCDDCKEEREVFADNRPSKCSVSNDHKVSPLAYVREWVTYRRENRKNDGYMVELDHKGRIIAETDGNIYRYNIPVEMPRTRKEVTIQCLTEGKYFGISLPPEYIPDTDATISMKYSTQERDVPLSFTLYWLNLGEALNGGDAEGTTLPASHGALERVVLTILSGKGKVPGGYLGGNVDVAEGEDEADFTMFSVEASFHCLV